MCRTEVDKLFIEENNNESQMIERRWSIINKKEVENKTYIHDLDAIFVKSFEILIS